MKPPYTITPQLLKLVSQISEKLGEVKGYFLEKPLPDLRKQYKAKTIFSTLRIEGNTLSLQQVTQLLDKKHITGTEKEITEVLNANEIYNNLNLYSPFSIKSFRKAHKVLMKNLIEKPGIFRNSGVGIALGDDVVHIAPPAKNVTYLMNDLFDFLKNDDEHILIKSCVFHYEMEFIHPFADGNGRMGRLWQTLILMDKYPVFEYLPFETLIIDYQKEYYKSLSISDKNGNSTIFIEFMLEIIDKSLKQLLEKATGKLTAHQRLDYILALSINEFIRKDYMNIFKTISSATASRDLKLGVEKEILLKTGDKNKTKYIIKPS